MSSINSKAMDYLVLAFYLIKPLEDPQAVIKKFKFFFNQHDVMGRLYINEEGINAQMSVSEKDAPLFFNWYFEDDRFKDTDIKVHRHHEHVFPKKTVKYRKELVALGQKVDYKQGGKHASPEEWKKMLDERDENTLVLDVRNDYEWEVGHFAEAQKPDFKTFREFPNSVKKLQGQYDPKKTRVLMYCTGGIRCELYSCLMKEAGYEQVYQLDGGVIKYGQEVGNDHWKGNLFVFDDRLVVPIAEEENEVIGTCRHCGEKTDACYNCANMDCNDLFLSCASCSKTYLGCCSSLCIEAPRRREAVSDQRPKPFRKLPFEEKQKYPHSPSTC
jgi:UPF0176 protein